MNRALTPVALLLVALCLAGCEAVRRQLSYVTGDAATRLAARVVIERDEWGVPHVHGRSDAAVAFGVAWAMAEDGYRELEEGYVRDLGRSAYYYGARYLADDLVRAAFRVESEARAEYAREPESRRQVWDGYAAGLNYWLRRHPDQRRVLARYEPWMVLARARRVAADEAVAGRKLGELATLLGEPEAGWRREEPAGGGAAWAIGAPHTADGRALLLWTWALPFFGIERPYEVELRSGSGWHVYGLARLGTPVPHAGHNDRLAWAHVELPSDTGVVRALPFTHPTDSLLYLADDGWERAEAWVDTVHVNTDTGVEARAYRLLWTRFGPVVARRGDTAYAVSPARAGSGGGLQRSLELGRARSLDDVASVLAGGNGGGVATVAADVEGNILLHAGGSSEPLPNPPGGVVRAGGGGGRPPPGDGGWTAAALGRQALGVAPVAPSAEVAMLVNEWEEVGGRDSRRAFALDSAVELLRRWDGLVTAASPEATLWHAWRTEQRALAASGPDGAAVGGHARFAALESAVARLRRERGTEVVAWGEFNLLQRFEPGQWFAAERAGEPVLGLPDGSLFELQSMPVDGRRYALGGTAAVLVVELGVPPRARSVVVFGQSGHPGSPHWFDQASRWAAGELKEAWFGAEQVRPRAVMRYHPGEHVRDPAAETRVRDGP